jgi:acyl-CoA thioesterase-1
MRKGHYIAAIVAIVIFGFGCANNEKVSGTSAADAAKKTPAASKTKTIVFFGNSLTAGYGLSSTAEAFPALIQAKVDSLGLP